MEKDTSWQGSIDLCVLLAGARRRSLIAVIFVVVAGCRTLNSLKLSMQNYHTVSEG